MLGFPVKNAVAFLVSFWQDADTNVRNMATDLQVTTLLDGHPMKYRSKRDQVQKLEGGIGMIVQKHGYQTELLFQ